LDIPIILRSLAGSLGLAVIDERGLPLDSDISFLETLDVGGHQHVTSYELRWWTRKPSDLNKVEIMNPSNVKKCLAHFRKEKSKSFVLPAGAGAGAAQNIKSKSSDAIDLETSISGAGANAGDSILTNFGNAGLSAETIPDACRKCPKYCQLLSDVLLDVLKFKQFSSVMSTSSENLMNIGIRRASTFNLLHEASILKETADVPPLAEAPKRHHISEVASSELKRLQDLPPTSYKWTWGESLSNEEVLKLRRIGTRPGRKPHSGYDTSLPEGKPGGEDSAGPSSSHSLTGHHDDLPDEASLPPTDLPFPEYFSKADHRNKYNPFNASTTAKLRLPSVSGSGRVQPALDSTNIDVAANWTDSNASSGKDNFDVAANWSDSDAGTSNGNLDVAANWSDSDAVSGKSNFDVAAKWSDSDAVSGKGNFDVAAKWSDSDAVSGKGNFDVAAKWSDSDAVSGKGNFDVAANRSATERIEVPDPEGVLGLAEMWNYADDTFPEHSGDELVTPSYACELSGPALSDITDIANQWTVSDEEPANEGTLPVQTELTFGPEDFSFFRDEMFE
jgi:hypothetical protein